MNIENMPSPIDLSTLDLLPIPILVTKDWDIIYTNPETKTILKELDISNHNLLEFFSEEQKNFLILQLGALKPETYRSFSLIFNIHNQQIPLFFIVKSFKDLHGEYYYIILLQKIEEVESKFRNLNRIIIETFTLSSPELYKSLIKKIVEIYGLDGALIFVEKTESQKEKFSIFYTKDNLNLDSYKLSEKLKNRLDKYGSLIIEKDFNKLYPDDTLINLGVESLIAIKVDIHNEEKIYFMVFSKNIISNIDELHFTLTVCSIKIISEYIRDIHYIKYENFYKTFLYTNDAVFIHDLQEKKIIDCNPAFCKLINYNLEDVLGKSIFEVIGSEYSERYKKIFNYFYNKNKLKNSKVRLMIKNSIGVEIPVEASITFIKQKNQTWILGILRDLSLTIEALDKHRKYLQTLSLLNLHVIELDQNLNVLYLNYIPNSKFPRLSYSSSFIDIIQDDYQEYVRVVLNNLFLRKKSIRIRFPIKISKTRNEWFEADFIYIINKKNKFIRGIIKDITLEYISEKQFILLAEHDILTSLPNRNRLEEDLYKAILRTDRNRTMIAVGFLDLDKFYHVNELLGHRFGDLVLSIFAEKLRQIPEISYSVYRWGGDQFVFFIENIKNKSDLFPFIEKLRQVSKEAIYIEGEKFFVTFTVGIAIYPIDGMTIDTLYGEADKALNYGKQNGRFQFIFASNLPKKSSFISKFEIRSHLLEAISENKIEPYFQPIYDIQENRIAGMEALARLKQFHKDIYIGPDIFIPIAEDLGLIEELSFYMMKKSLEFYKKVNEIDKLYISINVSRRLLHSDLFLMNLFDLQKELNLDSSGIIVEITESLAMLDKESNLRKLYYLRELGFKIAIDDFGTGYSSLAELQDLPISIIKIDKLFIKKLKSDQHNRILEAIIILAKGLNYEIIAEGVEDIETLKKLYKMGIRYVQGFFFAPPLSSEDFMNKLKNYKLMDLNYLS